MDKLDLKKILKPYYDAKPTPNFVTLPAFNFLMVDGKGNPNTAPVYAEAIQTLYSIAYTLKFWCKNNLQIDYPVMPLEGLWWVPDMNLFNVLNKEDWFWTMMISTPDFITQEMVNNACIEARRKKDLPALQLLRYDAFTEGPSAQIMHIGPYAAEAQNIQLIHEFIHKNGYAFDGNINKHHEIYLSDPNRTAPERLKTIIRQSYKPVN